MPFSSKSIPNLPQYPGWLGALIGDPGVHVDAGVLARRESRLLRCVVPGCNSTYEIPDPKPVPSKTSVEAYLDSLVPSLHPEPVTGLSPEARYICSRHPRVGSHSEVFNYLGRTEREFYSTKHGRIRESVIDRDAQFQEHLNRAAFRFDTSAAFRHLIRPDTFPEFLPPTPEELVRLQAASEEYNRPSWCRPAWRCAGKPVALPRDAEPRHSHKKWKRTAAPIEEWERKLRDAFQKDYEYAVRQAEIVLQKYISQLMRERDTATRERRI